MIVWYAISYLTVGIHDTGITYTCSRAQGGALGFPPPPPPPPKSTSRKWLTDNTIMVCSHQVFRDGVLVGFFSGGGISVVIFLCIVACY